MKNSPATIIYIKLLHTFIWFCMASSIFYVVYAGLTGTINNALYLALGLISLEFIALILNGWTCPLVIVAKNANPNWKDGDDIYLPKWLSKNNKTIFGFLLVFGIILLMFRHIY